MMTRNYKPELVGVFGCPVAENPTVVMMEAAFRHLGIDWRYLTIEVKPEDLADAVKGMKAFNMRGINLTIPHKIEVMRYLHEIAEDARLIGAVNTVVNDGGRLRGENTDGKGFVRSLKDEFGNVMEGSRVCLLGAGGAARAIAVELALAGAAEATIVNRSRAKGEALVATLNARTKCRARYLSWEGALKIPESAQILVNATSVGLFPNIDAAPNIDYDSIRNGTIVCDVIPNPPRSLFLRRAEARGARTIDGLGMLVNQGVIGFKLWTGLDAPRPAMIKALTKEFNI
jgi:shikimate dehydrogenase